jgi:hypothetical protein
MSSQLFKQQIPTELVFELLDKISIKTDNYYIVDINAYKKGIFNNTIPQFIEKCIPYYFLSKRVYLQRELTCKSFITVLRQICNFNKITYKSQIKYDHSDYDIVYYIYFN